MKIRVTRSGGFAGVTLDREVEVSAQQLEKLRATGPGRPTPDAFQYQITANGKTFTADNDLIEKLLQGE